MVSFVTVLFCFCLGQLTFAKIDLNISPLNNYSKQNGRIVGGQDATNIQIPWMASLVYYGSHHCGGSIINTRTIITAAHCITFINTKYLKIRIGTKKLNTGGMLLRIEDIKIHENYTESPIFNNDIALIFLKNEIIYKPGKIEAIALPQYNTYVKDGSMAMVSGWGFLKHNLPVSPKMLQYVEVPILNQENCNKYMENLITDKQLCAGFLEGGKDACQQDSGGPLVYNKILIGIVSWGDECAKPGRPGVYTNVAALRNWIDDSIREYFYKYDIYDTYIYDTYYTITYYS